MSMMVSGAKLGTWLTYRDNPPTVNRVVKQLARKRRRALTKRELAASVMAYRAVPCQVVRAHTDRLRQVSWGERRRVTYDDIYPTR